MDRGRKNTTIYFQGLFFVSVVKEEREMVETTGITITDVQIGC